MATNIIERDGRKFVLIGTSNAYEVPAGCAVITSNLREVKGSVVPAEQKYRNAIIPEFTVPDSVDRRFAPLLLDKFYSLAKAYLDEQMESSNRMLREIPLEDFSVDKMLSFFSRVAVSNRLTGETVGAWFDSSATAKSIKAKAEAKGMDVGVTLKKYRDLFVKTASPNHGINPNTCTVLLAMIDTEEAKEGIGETLAGKWAATVEKSTQSEVEAL